MRRHTGILHSLHDTAVIHFIWFFIMANLVAFRLHISIRVNVWYLIIIISLAVCKCGKSFAVKSDDSMTYKRVHYLYIVMNDFRRFIDTSKSTFLLSDMSFNLTWNYVSYLQYSFKWQGACMTFDLQVKLSDIVFCFYFTSTLLWFKMISVHNKFLLISVSILKFWRASILMCVCALNYYRVQLFHWWASDVLWVITQNKSGRKCKLALIGMKK